MERHSIVSHGDSNSKADSEESFDHGTEASDEHDSSNEQESIPDEGDNDDGDDSEEGEDEDGDFHGHLSCYLLSMRQINNFKTKEWRPMMPIRKHINMFFQN